jgi:hypothetical protein
VEDEINIMPLSRQYCTTVRNISACCSRSNFLSTTRGRYTSTAAPSMVTHHTDSHECYVYLVYSTLYPGRQMREDVSLFLRQSNTYMPCCVRIASIGPVSRLTIYTQRLHNTVTWSDSKLSCGHQRLIYS